MIDTETKASQKHGMLLILPVALALLTPARALTFEKAGWLDRLVAYHKKTFFDDVANMPAVPINATLEPAPPGYTDAPGWDYNSVMRLIALVHASQSAKPVRRAIRRALEPTRRIYVSKGRNTFKLFPSLAKKIPNDIYYDINSLEYYADDILPEKYNHTDDDAIVVVSNPVEARLPSAQISIKLLKQIMEARAEANREMPSTTKLTFLWTTKETKEPKNTTETGGAGSEAPGGETTPNGGSPPDGGTSPGGEGGEGGETTPAAPPEAEA